MNSVLADWMEFSQKALGKGDRWEAGRHGGRWSANISLIGVTGEGRKWRGDMAAFSVTPATAVLTSLPAGQSVFHHTR